MSAKINFTFIVYAKNKKEYLDNKYINYFMNLFLFEIVIFACDMDHSNIIDRF